MQLPARVETVYRELYALNMELAHGDDEARRALTRAIAEQVRYELGPQWGTKRADATRPISKDSIAFQSVTGVLFSFDWQNGQTREPNPAGEMENITGQVFVEVDPINHLGSKPPAPPPMPTPPDIDQLYRRIDALEITIDALEMTVEDLAKVINIQSKQLQLLSTPRIIETNRVWGHTHKIQF